MLRSGRVGPYIQMVQLMSWRHGICSALSLTYRKHREGYKEQDDTICLVP